MLHIQNQGRQVAGRDRIDRPGVPPTDRLEAQFCPSSLGSCHWTNSSDLPPPSCSACHVQPRCPWSDSSCTRVAQSPWSAYRTRIDRDAEARRPVPPSRRDYSIGRSNHRRPGRYIRMKQRKSLLIGRHHDKSTRRQLIVRKDKMDPAGQLPSPKLDRGCWVGLNSSRYSSRGSSSSG